MRIAVAIELAGFGYFIPDIWLKNASQKRQKKIQLSLPDALDLMVTCAEAGLSLEALLKRVASEMVRSGPELADELGLTCIEMEFLPDRRQALVNLADRTDLPGIRALVNALQQSSKFGTPLSQAMRVLASEFRDERIVKAEEKDKVERRAREVDVLRTRLRFDRRGLHAAFAHCSPTESAPAASLRSSL